MTLIHQWLVYGHVLIGSLALVIFWIPIAATKGSPLHRQAGVWFARFMIFVSISGLVTSLMVIADPMGIRYPGESFSAIETARLSQSHRFSSLFLLMLSFLVLLSTLHGLHSLRARDDREQLRSMPMQVTGALLGLVAIAVGYIGLSEGRTLLMIFSGISLWVSINFFRYIYKTEIKPREWVIEHLGAMIGAGIGAYTAFFAFGGRALLSEYLSGQWQVVPWVLPSIIGVTASAIYSRKYRRRLKLS